MNTMNRIVMGFFLASSMWTLGASFRNLGFEEADLSSIVPYRDFTNGVPTTFGGYGRSEDVLPGWSVTVPGGFTTGPREFMDYNNRIAEVSIFDAAGARRFALPRPREGIYMLGMDPLHDTSSGRLLPISLSQNGLIPTEARTLIFTRLSGTFDVRVNDQTLPLSPHGDDFVADVSSFSGTEATVSFFTQPLPGQFPFWALDDIRFSPVPIPEPTSLCWLVLLGALFLIFRRK